MGLLNWFRKPEVPAVSVDSITAPLRNIYDSLHAHVDTLEAKAAEHLKAIADSEVAHALVQKEKDLTHSIKTKLGDILTV